MSKNDPALLDITGADLDRVEGGRPTDGTDVVLGGLVYLTLATGPAGGAVLVGYLIGIGLGHCLY